MIHNGAPINQTPGPHHDGLSIRYAESEPRNNNGLLLRPWPESTYCYEPAWTRLAEHIHLLAVDLPGFGISERRDQLMCRTSWASSSFGSPTRSVWSSRTEGAGRG